MPDKPKKTWRRWFQFRLSTWLLWVLILVLALLWWRDHKALQLANVTIRVLNARVDFLKKAVESWREVVEPMPR